MPHTNRKHVRSENQPSCTGCLTDQQVRKLTLILAKTPKTLNAASEISPTRPAAIIYIRDANVTFNLLPTIYPFIILPQIVFIATVFRESVAWQPKKQLRKEIAPKSDWSFQVVLNPDEPKNPGTKIKIFTPHTMQLPTHNGETIMVKATKTCRTHTKKKLLNIP